MFEHPQFETYSLEDVPLHRDVFLMDEVWMADYETAMVSLLSGGEDTNVGYISYASVKRVNNFGLELSWFPNISDRYHEMTVFLPRDAFVACVGCQNYDEKPHIFVKASWLEALHLHRHSAFALIDAIGMKDAIQRQELERSKLITLRDQIDRLASIFRDVSFISFADSLLLKINWSVGMVGSDVKYSYDPETLIRLLPDLSRIYQDVLGLKIYAAITQGLNEYYDDPLHHISETRNHICLNSLGLPFAQLMAIDDAARTAIRSGKHQPAELYIDEQFFRSLRFRFGFDKNALPRAAYSAPLSEVPKHYVCCDTATILNNLDCDRTTPPGIARCEGT